MSFLRGMARPSPHLKRQRLLGTASGGGRFAEGDTCTVTATANEGYVFVNWTEEGTSVADSMAYSFEVRHDRHLVANFVVESAVLYTVTAQAEPEEGGRVTGGGTYEEGQTCTLTATADECYDFVNWTKDGEEVSQDTVCTFDVTGDVTYMAHFQLKRYAITVAADPTNGGEVIGGDTYDCGETCTVRATEAQGYTFVNWTENNTVVSSDDDYTFAVERGRDLVANFVELQPNQYVIQVVIDPSGGGTVIGNGPYNEGQTCTLTATPENCYEFVNWTKNGEVVSQNSVYTFNVTEAATYVAHFQLINYKVTVSAGTGGSAYVGEMQGVFSQNVDCGESCTVHARPEQGYTFVNWTENGIEASRERDYTFNVTDNHNLTANFTQETYTITVNAGTGGTASGGGQYHYGETAMLTATADDCYQFESWNDGNTDNPREVTVTGNATYTASFSSLHYTITVTHGTGGTAHLGSSTGPTSQEVDCGTDCKIYAVANEHYEFDNWTEGSTVVSSNAIHTVNNVTENHTFKANFTLKQYTITVTHTPSAGGTATISGGGTTGSYTYNQQCTVVATLDTGYHFLGWYKNGTRVSQELSYTFPVVDSCTLEARFEINTYTITVNASPANGGTVQINNGTAGSTASGSFTHGTTIQLKAIANSGYDFSQWNDGGAQTHTVTVTAGETYTATFSAQTTDQTFTVNGVPFTMKRVEGGTFWMGAQSTNQGGQNYDSEAYDNESPVHSVTLSTFYMGETEVTQELWQAVMGSNPSYFSGTNLPVEMVSWNMIVNEFLPALNAATGQNFRLPTEAEWEYAARGGNQGHGYKYAGGNTIGDVAWYNVNSSSQTHAVATKQPNELGLYDMSGNVYELCSDWYGNYSSGSQTNPQGPSSGSRRVLRGGCWGNDARDCRVSTRIINDPVITNHYFGFRLALPQ